MRPSDADSYYPQATSLLPPTSLPQALNFIQGGIDTLLDDIFIKDIQFTRSASGDTINYVLILKIYKRIGMDIPGTGMSILLNPPQQGDVDPNSSDIPISIDFQLEILKELPDFSFDSFSASAEGFYDLLVDFFDVEDDEIIEEVLNIFVSGKTLNKFVDDINVHYNLSGANLIPYPVSTDSKTAINEVITSINNSVMDLTVTDVIFDVYFTSASETSLLNNVNKLFKSFAGASPVDTIKNFLIPKVNATLTLSPAIEFPRTILVPIKPDGTIETNTAILSRLNFAQGEFLFSTESGIGFSDSINVSFPPEYPKAQIANTSFKFGFQNAKLDLSRNSNIPEVTADGRPNTFVGVFVQDAVIDFPAFWQKDATKSNAEIFGHNLIIGTGGISGTVGLRALDANNHAVPLLHTQFGGSSDDPDSGFEISLTSFDLTFQQNAIVHSDINGQLALPEKIKSVGSDGKAINARVVFDVAIAIGNGDFSITAKPLVNPLMFNIADIANFTVTSISAGKEDDRYYVEAAGKIKITYDTPPFANFLPSAIDIQRLRIWSDGHIEFVGGGDFKLRKPISLRFPPVEMTITAIHLGSYEGFHIDKIRKYLYFGFDGTLSINPGGIEGKGSGIKFYFTQDNHKDDDPLLDRPLHVFMRIQTIEIDMIIPQENPALTLQGILSMQDAVPTAEFPNPGTEYIGSVQFELNRLKISGSAGMRLNPKVPAFLIDVSLELSTPIILGATGLGIYGFRGLFGHQYVASKTIVGLTEEDRWYDYYKKKVPPVNKEGVDIGKFDLKKKGFSIGVGASLATADDEGMAFSSKLFLLLSLPNAFLLQGQAQIIKKQRLQLDDTTDPPFSLLLAIDDQSLSVTIGVKFLVPNDPDSPKDAGKIVDGFGEFDFAFFWHDASAWYLNFGTDQRPIQASILNLFRSYAFLMISARGIKFGAGASFEKSINLAVLKIHLWAQIDLGAQISFKPVQFGGFIALGGGVSIKVFGFSFSLTVAAGLAGEAPKPFNVTGSLEVCVHVLRKNRCGKIEFTWEFSNEVPKEPVYFIAESSDGGNAQVAKAINMLTGEGFNLLSFPSSTATLPDMHTINLDDYVIPVDSFINIEFNKGVKADDAIAWKIGGDRGGVSQEYVPPVKGKHERVVHNYTVKNIEIFCHNGTQWNTYDIYSALTPWDTAPFIQTTDTSTYPIGYWQLDMPDKKNKLAIMATNPVTFLRNANVVYEELGVSVEHLLCVKDQRVKQCAHISSLAGSSLSSGKVFSLNSGVKIQLFTKDGKLLTFPNVFNEAKALQINPGSYVQLYYPQPSPQVSIKLSAFTENVRVTYEQQNSDNTYTQIQQSVVSSAALTNEVVYTNADQPVSRIRIEPVPLSGTTALSCGLPLPEAALLLTTLNTMTQGGGLTSGDPYNGTRLYLDKAIQSQYLPAGYTAAQLHLEAAQYLRRRWTFVISRSLNPEAPRTGELRIGGLLIPFLLPAFNVLNPLNDSQVIITVMKAVFLNSGKFTVVSQTATTLTIEAIDVSTQLTDIPNTNAFVAYLSPDSGRAFSYSNVVSFSNLRPDTAAETEGLNYGFVADALLAGGDLVSVKGYTDVFPVVCCNGGTARYVSETCSTASASLLRLQQQREVLLGQYSHEQQLCTTLSHNPSCQAESLPHCNLATQLGLQITELNNQIAVLNTYINSHCPVDGSSICQVDVPVQQAGSILLYGSCWLNAADYAYNQNLPDYQYLLNDTTALISRFEKTIQPIWRPETVFAVRLEIIDYVGSDLTQLNLNQPSAFYTYLFQTKGPIGHFHQFNSDYQKLALENKQDQFKLADLRHYADLALSYPNADGNLLSAKPLYYNNPKLYLFFKRDYVYAMFQGYASYQGLPEITSVMNKLEVSIKDPSLEDSIQIEGNNALWDEDQNAPLPRDIRALMNLVNSHDPCMDVTISRPKGVHLEITPPALKPLKLYSAMYRTVFTPEENLGPADVLTYNFQTSRYADFSSHINSYILEDTDVTPTATRKALFDVKLRDFTASDYANALQIINGTMTDSNPLMTQFMNPYDRLIDGVMKQALPPAVTAEFNIIRDYSLGNASSDYILGILIRSPEPFNDPKIPIDRLKQAIRVLLADGVTSDTSFSTVIYSKDVSNVFISNSTLNISAATLLLHFDYLIYSKDGFTAVDSVTVPIDTPASVSKLAGSDCGRTEVNFTDTLQAVVVKDAESYQFLVERATESFSQSYTRNDADALLPLGGITGLDYNRAYTVKIKVLEKEALTNIERLSSFGPVCTITTRVLKFTVQALTQKYQYVNVPLTLNVALLFNNGSSFAYDGQVTLNLTGSASGAGVIPITAGSGSITLQDSVAETVQLSLTDSGNTGYDVGYHDTIQFIEHATRYLISVPTGVFPVSSQNFPVPVHITAVGPAGITDLGYIKPVNLIASGSGLGAGLVTMNSGTGSKYITSVRSQIVTLSLANVAPEVLDVSDTKQLLFVRGGNIYVIKASSQSATVNKLVTISVRVLRQDSNLPDATFDIGIKVKAAGAVQGDQVVAITNGVGSVQVSRSTAGTIVVSLEDIYNTGLNHSSTATITYYAT
jgi:hypothetical protein